MDELNRELANGMLGWDQADRAMSGDLAGAYRDEAAREVIEPGYRGQPPWTPRGPAVPGPTIAGALVLLLVVLVIVLLIMS